MSVVVDAAAGLGSGPLVDELGFFKHGFFLSFFLVPPLCAFLLSEPLLGVLLVLLGFLPHMHCSLCYISFFSSV